MPKVNQVWTVLPHGKLTKLDPNLFTVTSTLQLPFTKLPRRMTIARLADRRLVVFSAIALDANSMLTLEAYGKPAFLVVPSDKHRVDAKIWKDRYPDMLVVAPRGARLKVEQVVHVDLLAPQFDDPAVEFITVAGTAGHEAALLVHTKNGSTLVLNDLVGNMRTTSGFGSWFLRMMRFAGDEPRITRPAQWTLITDRPALRAKFLKWAALPKLKRILVSHGEPIDVEPAEALRDFAQSLASDRPVPRTQQRRRPENLETRVNGLERMASIDARK